MCMHAVCPTINQTHADVLFQTVEITQLHLQNDRMINSFNPVQLSAWHANVDMQYIVSCRRVIDYCTKYVAKCEP